MVLNQERFFAAFRVPSQRAVRETAAPGLMYGIHNAARGIELQRADRKTEDHNRAGLRGPGRSRHSQSGSDLHPPLPHGVAGVGKQLVAMADKHVASHVMVSVREVPGSPANLGVGQLCIGQSITDLGWQHRQGHRLIMPHSLIQHVGIGFEDASSHSQGGLVIAVDDPDGATGSDITYVMVRLKAPELEIFDTLITAGIANSRAEAIRWALARISERPAYAQLREHTRDIQRLKTEF